MVTRDRIGPKSAQLGPIHYCLLEEAQGEKELILSIQDWILSLDLNRFRNTEMQGRFACPVIRKSSSVHVLAHS